MLILDYRKIPRALSKVYYDPLNPATRSEFAKLFRSLTSADEKSTEIVTNRSIEIWGRTLTIPESSGSVARFTFADLCGKPLSAPDYLKVTETFQTVFVEGIPQMGLGERDMVGNVRGSR